MTQLPTLPMEIILQIMDYLPQQYERRYNCAQEAATIGRNREARIEDYQCIKCDSVIIIWTKGEEKWVWIQWENVVWREWEEYMPWVNCWCNEVIEHTVNQYELYRIYAEMK
jgi:hypothetical protein